ncbi:HD-GYP domain-containing protein [Lacrimispora aerotolerans]|uniref:HD-GYP domain-containing protein n=1 Tax=Lacrimispora aerotolerans TaxID=36832 RepID=UPI00068DF942|nr:HD domain-containing phosphohydrolase [Lacrimispora aerotolerans]
MYRILAIDDTSFFLRVLEDMLSEYYEVFTTVSGEIAFRYMEQISPDLILLDLAMPKIDGWQIMKQLKTRPDCSDIPVIFITSQTDKAIEAECLKMGAYDFISKPVVKEVLLCRVRRALETKDSNRQLKRKLEQKTKELETISLASVNAIAALIDARDNYTKGHSERVARYSVLIGENMNWCNEEIRRLYEIALLHDVGKVGVPDEILLKTTELTAEEKEIMKTHTVIGGDILKDISTVRDLELGARYHHERFDGKGYPEGLMGAQIPLLARIICVADSFDAMSSNRCYRPKLDPEVIKKELLRGSGKQFDPEVVWAFLKTWEDLPVMGEKKQRRV